MKPSGSGLVLVLPSHVRDVFLRVQMLITRGATSIPTATAAPPTPTAASGVQASVCRWEATARLQR